MLLIRAEVKSTNLTLALRPVGLHRCGLESGALFLSLTLISTIYGNRNACVIGRKSKPQKIQLPPPLAGRVWLHVPYSQKEPPQ